MLVGLDGVLEDSSADFSFCICLNCSRNEPSFLIAIGGIGVGPDDDAVFEEFESSKKK